MDPDEIAQRRTRVLVPSRPDGVVRHFQDDHCANCGDSLKHWLPKLFCDDWCRGTAEIARYARGAVRDGRIDADPLVFHSIQMRLAFALIGGYQSFGRNVAQGVREEVLARDDGRCVRCGEPANQLDHIAGNDNSAGNLQLLCDGCHRAKTQESLVPAQGEEGILQKLVWVVRVWPD